MGRMGGQVGGSWLILGCKDPRRSKNQERVEAPVVT